MLFVYAALAVAQAARIIRCWREERRVCWENALEFVALIVAVWLLSSLLSAHHV
jgi:hypothetical protein